MDTGADKSLISRKLVVQNGFQPTRTATRTHFTGADGKLMDTSNEVILSVMQQGSHEATITLHVANIDGILIGNDFLTEHKWRWDYNAKSSMYGCECEKITPLFAMVEYPNQPQIDLFDTVDSDSELEDELIKPHTAKIARIFVGGSIQHELPDSELIRELDFDDAEEPLDEEVERLLPQSLMKFKDVFSKRKGESLPPRRPGIDFEIQLKTKTFTFKSGGYKLNPQLSAVAKETLDKMEAAGLIRRVAAPVCLTPIMFVSKPDGSNRMCHDFRKLNEVTIDNVYPLPNIDELLSRLHGARCYTTIDLRSAYNQIRIAEGDEWKTQFKSPHGVYESLVLLFGLKNAPSGFQSFMDS